MNIITVSREFGSGGRELAKRLAERMGFAYYDREIIAEISNKTALAEGYVEQVLERGMAPFPIHVGRSFASSIDRSCVDVMVAQKSIIEELSSRGSCVIVGQNADVILQKENPLKLFVYADMEYKIARCRQKGQLDQELSDKDMKKAIREMDAKRSKTHDFLSSAKWGDKKAYHLCINTTGFEIKALIPAVAEFSKCFFDR